MKPQANPSAPIETASVLSFSQQPTLSVAQSAAIQEFIDQVGGVENAQRALEALLKLEIAA